MTPEEALQFVPLLTAYGNGQTVQCKLHEDWEDADNLNFGLNPDCYRVKPVPHDIKWAARNLLAGIRVRRSSWSISACHLRPTEAAIGLLLPDILADDWELYEPK